MVICFLISETVKSSSKLIFFKIKQVKYLFIAHSGLFSYYLHF